MNISNDIEIKAILHVVDYKLQITNFVLVWVEKIYGM